MSMTISQLRLVEGNHDQSRRSNHWAHPTEIVPMVAVGRNDLGSSASGLLSLQAFFSPTERAPQWNWEATRHLCLDRIV